MNNPIEELNDLLDEIEPEGNTDRIRELIEEVKTNERLTKSIEYKSFEELVSLKDALLDIEERLAEKEDVDLSPITKLLADLIVEAQKKVDIQKVEVTNPTEPITEINVRNFPEQIKDLNVNRPKWLDEIKPKDFKNMEKYLELMWKKGIETKIDNYDARKPLAVRLSDGRKFYNAIFQAAVAGGGSSQKQANFHERVSNTNGTSTAFSVFGATASKRNFITDVTVFNSSGTTGYVDFRDGTTGGIIWTFPLPAGGGATHSFSHALRQPSLNTALAYDVSAALSTVYISVNGYKE